MNILFDLYNMKNKSRDFICIINQFLSNNI